MIEINIVTVLIILSILIIVTSAAYVIRESELKTFGSWSNKRLYRLELLRVISLIGALALTTGIVFTFAIKFILLI